MKDEKGREMTYWGGMEGKSSTPSEQSYDADMLSRMRVVAERLANTTYTPDGQEALDVIEWALARLTRSEIGATEQEPVAWRYRFVNDGPGGDGAAGQWRYVDKVEDCNPSECYERQPLYPMKWEESTPSASGDNGWEIGANVRGLLERVKLHFQKGDPNDARYSGLSNEELADLFTARCVEASKEGELLYFEICNLLQRAKATALTPPATVEAWRPMVNAPLDGTEIEILFRHFDYWTSLKLDGKEKADKQWQAAQRAHWIDHNGGGWTWHGMAGTPVGWRPLDAIDSRADTDK